MEPQQTLGLYATPNYFDVAKFIADQEEVSVRLRVDAPCCTSFDAELYNQGIRHVSCVSRHR